MPHFGLLRRFLSLFLLGFMGVATSAQGQTFNNLIFFGDSNTDSGRYVYLPQTIGDSSTIRKGGFTTNPGLMWSTALGQRFGITVTPSSAPGGGNNYAAGGSRILHSNSNKNQWSATQQVAAYLASVSGFADPNALFTMNIGTNDLKTTSEIGSLGAGDYGNIVNPRDQPKIIDLGQRTAGLVAQLYAAGARSFLVPNMFTSSSNTVTGSRDLYSQTVWNTIADSGINFVPADARNLLRYVTQNASTFGILVTSASTPACGAVLSANCTAADLVTPDAATTYLFADTDGHLASGAQRIESDYYYSLLAAPSQISFLAESEIKRRLALISSIRNQIDISFARPNGASAWISGDIQYLRLRNTSGLPDDPGNPASLNAGLDVKTEDGWLIGGAVGYGGTKQRFNQAGGHFTTDGPNASLYAGYRSDTAWADVIASAGTLSFDIDRRVALGIATFSNTGTTSGFGLSLAAEAGYDWSRDAGLGDASTVKHGPVIGLIGQKVIVEGFTETADNGAPTALSFATQTRRSLVSEIGYRASLSLGAWEPFARATWNHELITAQRDIQVSLTSITAPSYKMPAASPGRNFATLGLGTRYQLSDNVRSFVSISSQLGQARARTFGIQLGMNVLLN